MLHVPLLDVAAVFAQVQGDAVRAGLFRDSMAAWTGIGIAGAARLAQRRDVIDIDAEQDGTHRGFSITKAFRLLDSVCGNEVV